jgi:hypothetical protein
MIPDRFDALAKALPAATRRDAMRVLVGLPLAGGLASLLTPGEPASARKHGRKPEKKHRRARGKKDRNRADPDCPTCTCPPDRRLAAVDACRAKQGVAVAGSARGDGCNCAWLNSATSPNDYRCNGECLCWLTVEGSGWCGAYDPPLPDRGTQPCFASTDCPPIIAGTGLALTQACVIWPNGGGPYCWPQCAPRCAAGEACPEGLCCDEATGRCVASCPAPGFCGGSGTAGICGLPPARTCPAGGDLCADWDNPALAPCHNGECGCFRSIEGASFCGRIDGACASCTRSEDCAPGEVCWVIDGICTCEGSDGNCTCEGLTSSCVPVC